MILSYGVAQATAWRSRGSLNGGHWVFIATYHTALGIGTPLTRMRPPSARSRRSLGSRP